METQLIDLVQMAEEIKLKTKNYHATKKATSRRERRTARKDINRTIDFYNKTIGGKIFPSLQ